MFPKTCSFRVNERLCTSVSSDTGRCLVSFPQEFRRVTRPPPNCFGPGLTGLTPLCVSLRSGELPKPRRRIRSLPGLPEPRPPQQRVSYFPGGVSYSKILQPAAPLTHIPRPSKTFEFAQHLPPLPFMGNRRRWVGLELGSRIGSP